jgi:hypothetical protein
MGQSPLEAVLLGLEEFQRGFLGYCIVCFLFHKTMEMVVNYGNVVIVLGDVSLGKKQSTPINMVCQFFMYNKRCLGHLLKVAFFELLWLM